ncbi:MAG: ATP-binding cassette domain-containing protein [Vicinamibacterales bacterium]|jgi:ABC-type polar amino acid transport system ATPase subunit|nr:ATP-binding cassette domain-containing protein [Vicinamibacterales bacterium]
MSGPVLDARGIALRRGSREVLRGVDLRVGRGELVALMGLSGGGKTTFLRAVAGLEAFDAGTLSVDGVSLQPGGLPPAAVLKALRRTVGMVFQLHHLFEHMTAMHNVWLALVHVHGVPRHEAERRAAALLELMGVGARAHALPRELSGGEAQRVAIARALAVDPPLLLMDEPTASLDPARRDDLGDTLERLTQSGRTLLAATHDDDFVRDYADRVLVMADGQVVEEGTPAAVLGSPQHPATQQLLSQTKRLNRERGGS